MRVGIWRLLAGLVFASVLAGCDSNYEPNANVQTHLRSAGFLPYQGKGYFCPKEKCGAELLMVYMTGKVDDLGDESYSAQNEIVSRRLDRNALKKRILSDPKIKGFAENFEVTGLDFRSATVFFSGKFTKELSGHFFQVKVRVIKNTIFMSGLAGQDKRLVSRYFSSKILD